MWKCGCILECTGYVGGDIQAKVLVSVTHDTNKETGGDIHANVRET